MVMTDDDVATLTSGDVYLVVKASTSGRTGTIC